MNVFYRYMIALLLLTAPFWKGTRTAAQEGGTLTISAPDTHSFPSITIQMDAYDTQGDFLSDFTSENLRVIENEQALKPDSIEIVEHGLQVIIALNTSPSMAMQSQGTSAYQQIQQALADWAGQRPEDTQDDISLSTPTGLFLIRERDPEQAGQAFSEYQPDLINTQPSLSSLAEALDLATDPLDQPLMKRSILFITPELPASAKETVSDLVSRAKGLGVRLHIWMVVQKGSNAAADNPLQLLSESTGGQYTEFALPGPLPEIEPLFAPLRQTYQITYTSKIQKSGSNQLKVETGTTGLGLQSNSVRFSMDVQPPQPIFLSPPASVNRAAPDVAASAEQTNASEAVPLKILVEFPDGYNRELKASRLYVNGALALENTSEPFDRFTWQIGSLTTPGRQILRVEVVDALDLTGSSIEIPIEVTVDEPAAATLSSRISESGIIAVSAVAVAGLTLGLVLILNGNKRRAQKNRSNTDKKLRKDPVTQPVDIQQESSRPKKDKSSPVRAAISWPVRAPIEPSDIPARLVALDEHEEPITGGAVALARQEITFGTDPRRATQVLSSATVDGLHARLHREQDGQFYLADQGSVAGTWVNYAPVTSTGARLEHGDLIHIGKVMFRFELTDPELIHTAEVQVLDLER